MTSSVLAPRRTQAWQPVVERRRDCVTPAGAAALHELIERPGSCPDLGAPLPALWHWLAFLPRARQADLASDGHPRTGTFLPPADGRARMCAGGRVSRTGHLAVGQALHRESVVSTAVSKRGRSGELTFVTVRHEVGALDDEVSAGLREDEDLVYRMPGRCKVVRATLSGDVTPGDVDWTWGRHVAVDPTLLFRFSALTYNAHRIHYDRDYALVAGYPGLVVHGQLQAILLADAVERVHQGFATHLRFRAHAPAFDDYSLNLRARTTVDAEGRERVVAAAFSGRRLTMSLEATLGTPGGVHRPG